MTLALTDLLIELSDPRELQRFRTDPDKYLSNLSIAGLTSQDELALKSAKGSDVRFRAKSTESSDPTQQFNRYTTGDVSIISLHPVVEIHLPKDQIAVGGPDGLFIDSDGLIYRGIKDSVDAF